MEAMRSSLSFRLEKSECVIDSILSALCLNLFFLLLSLLRKLEMTSFYLITSLGVIY